MLLNLKGILPDKAVQVIDQLSNSLTSLSTKFTALASQPLVTKPQADAAYGPAAQQAALQVNGPNPLNLTGLIGILAQNQIAGIPNFTSIPKSGKYSQPGTLILVNGVLTVVTKPGSGTSPSSIPTGAAGGDLDGTYPNPGVGKVNAGVIPTSAGLLASNGSKQIVAAANTGVTPATYGDSTHVVVFTVNALGQITAASDVAISAGDVNAIGTLTPSYIIIGDGTNNITSGASNIGLIGALGLTPVNVSGLPPTPSVGYIAAVNNALAPVMGSAVAGGGAANCLVWWNGSQWTVFGV